MRFQCSVIMDKINKEPTSDEKGLLFVKRQKAKNNKWFSEDSEMLRIFYLIA